MGRARVGSIAGAAMRLGAAVEAHTESLDGTVRAAPPLLIAAAEAAQTHLDYPWSAIGRLSRASGGFCTGVLRATRPIDG